MTNHENVTIKEYESKLRIPFSKLQDYLSKLKNYRNEERALSYIHEEDNHLIMTDPLFSQPLSTTFSLLQDMIPSNPPHISHISWIRYANQILHDLLLRNRLE